MGSISNTGEEGATPHTHHKKKGKSQGLSIEQSPALALRGPRCHDQHQERVPPPSPAPPTHTAMLFPLARSLSLAVPVPVPFPLRLLWSVRSSHPPHYPGFWLPLLPRLVLAQAFSWVSRLSSLASGSLLPSPKPPHNRALEGASQTAKESGPSRLTVWQIFATNRPRPRGSRSHTSSEHETNRPEDVC